MKFISMVKSREGVPPSPKLMTAISMLGQEMAQKGVLVEMVGLTPSAQGGRIRLSGGKVSVTDGPFTESKELVGGYAIFEVASKAEAMKLGSQFVQLHADVMGPDYEMEVELRELYAPPGR